jgi:hypothetical protein
MKPMVKAFSHRGFHFNMKIDFDTTVERRLNGNRYHTITVIGTDYNAKSEFLSTDTEKYIISMENDAKKFADNQLDQDPLYNRLVELGFQ